MSAWQEQYDGDFLFDGAQNEIGLVPIEAVTTTTVTYTRSRLVNVQTSVGGTAYLRSRIVNSGGSV
jgi:hypothetical protein